MSCHCFATFSYYKIVENKTCAKKLFDAFLHIYEIRLFEVENHESILRRLVNCFSKGTRIRCVTNFREYHQTKIASKDL